MPEPTKTYSIRYATEQDVPQILAMIKELAIYENALHEVRATEQTLLDTLSFPTSDKKAGFAKTLLVAPAENPTNIAGMALFFHNYSTWNAAPGIYLEDLFVRPEFRGRGFGKALLQTLAKECVDNGYGRLDWSVLKWNKPSIDFYISEAIGAVRQEEWVGMRVDGEGLKKLAGGV